jgi:basic amino acid/polyamine antiporter, APA family
MSFRRALGPFDAAMVVIGGIIGAGIFTSPYVVAQRVPTGPLVLLAWAVGGAIACAGALSFAELGSLFPQVGGQYVYLRRALHPLAGFLYGWAMLLIIVSGGIAAVSITFAQHAMRLVGSTGDPRVLAVLAIGTVAVVNYVGVKPGSRLLNVFVVLKVAALVGLIIAGLFIPGAASGAAPAAPATRTLPLFAFGGALIPILFSYGGWQNANYVAEEIRNPRRNLPISLIAGTAVVVLVYVGANFVYLRALGHDGLAASSTPAADAALAAFGPIGDRLITVAITISTFGFLNLSILAPSRVYYAMAKDGLFFRSVATLHPKFQTPTRAIVLQASWAIVLALTGTYGDLADTVVFADWIFFASTVAAVFVFRRRFPLETRPRGSFVAPGYPLVPFLFIATGAFVVASVIASNPVRSAIGALLLATGVPAYIYWTWGSGPVDRAAEERAALAADDES